MILKAAVSVIITSCNQEEYLQEAIESVIHQTWRPHEIIIADDHSTKDNSVALIQDYVARHHGWIRAILQEKNVRIPRNRNSALRTVTGDHVALLDGDDRFLPQNLETHMTTLARHPEAGCSFSDRFEITAKGERLGTRYHTPQPSGHLLAHIAAGHMGILRTLIARYDLMKEVGFLDERFLRHDGFILTLRLARLTEFVYIPVALVEKRSHPASDSKTISHEERAGWFEQMLPEILAAIGHLPSIEIQQIRAIWLQKISKERELAKIPDNSA